MEHLLPVKDAGLQALDSHSMRHTDGGLLPSPFNEFAFKMTEWIYMGLSEMSRGAAESAAEMPGLK